MSQKRESTYLKDLCKEYLKKAPIFFAIIAIPFVGLKGKIVEILNKFWVNPIASNIGEDEYYLTDIFVVVIGIFLAWDYIQKLRKTYQLRNNIFLIVLTSSCWYISAWCCDTWNFVPFLFLLKKWGVYFPYTHFIFIIIFLGSLLVWGNYHYKSWQLSKKNQKSSPSKGFLVDSPKESLEEGDIYQRGTFINDLAEKIEYTHNEKQSFAIGVVGSWGSGKTSLMNALKNRLAGNKKKAPVIMEFNPWQSSTQSSVVDAFFEQLRGLLSDYNGELGSQIHSYANKLLSIDENPVTKISRIGLEYFVKKQDTDSLYKSINETIKLLGRQLIIFIDDVDRLDKDEVVEVVRLIRNTANFGNTVFVVAYDRNYVLYAIKSINEYRSEAFLEKIFQLELNLPSYEKSIISNALSNRLKAQLPKSLHGKVDEFISGTRIIISVKDYISNDYYLEGIQNIRDVNRLVNSFSLVINLLTNPNTGASEVVFDDLLKLEILRLKYPSVYVLLAEKTKQWLSASITPGVLYPEGERYPTYKLIKWKNDSKTSIENYLDENYVELCVPKGDIKYIIKILNDLFQGIQQPLFSIGDPIHFKKYFAYRLLDGDLSEIEYTRLLLNDKQEEFNNWLEEQVKAKKGIRLAARFREYETPSDFGNKTILYEKIIKGIFHLENYMANQTPINFLEYPFPLDTKDISTLIFIGNRLYRENSNAHRELLEKLFQEASYPFVFERDLIYKQVPIKGHTESDLSFPIPLEQRITIAKKYLDEYLAKTEMYNRKIDNEIFELARACQYDRVKNDNIIVQLDDGLKEKLKTFISEHDIIRDYIKTNIYRPPGAKDGHYAFGGIMFHNIFETIPEFLDFLSKRVDTSFYRNFFHEVAVFLRAYAEQDTKGLPVKSTFSFPIVDEKRNENNPA